MIFLPDQREKRSGTGLFQQFGHILEIFLSTFSLKVYAFHAQKKDTDRRKGKGHHCCFWREELIKFVAVRAILKNGMNSSFSFKSSRCNSSYSSNRPVQNSQRDKELNKFCLLNTNDDLCLFIYPSSMVPWMKNFV